MLDEKELTAALTALLRCGEPSSHNLHRVSDPSVQDLGEAEVNSNLLNQHTEKAAEIRPRS